jgi:hypothetical protein
VQLLQQSLAEKESTQQDHQQQQQQQGERGVQSFLWIQTDLWR